MTSTKLAGAASPSAYGTCPEGVRLPGSLRASNVGAGAHGEGAPASAFVAARTDLSRGMPSLPAGCEVRAGTYTYPENCIEDGTTRPVAAT